MTLFSMKTIAQGREEVNKTEEKRPDLYVAPR